MQISALKKLLHLIRSSDSQNQQKSSEATLEQNKMQNAECKMQNSELSEASHLGRGGTAGDGEGCPHEQNDYDVREIMQNLEELEIEGDDEGETVGDGASTSRVEEAFSAGEKVGDGASTPRVDEAFAAENPSQIPPDTKSHLTSSVPKTARVPLGAMTKNELAEMRALFRNLDDNEIHRLYKKVTKQN